MVEWCTHTGNGNPSILKCLHASRITSYNLWGAGIFLTSFLAWLEIVTNVILCVCVFDTQSKMCEFLLVGHALIGDKQTICSVFLCCFWMFVVFFFVFFFSYSPSTLGSFYTQLYWHYGKSFVFLFDWIFTEVSRMQTDPNTWLWLSGNQVLSRW